MMPSYGQAYRWLFWRLRESDTNWSFRVDWYYRIELFLFGVGWTYGQDRGKYPPDEEPRWRPLRDAWKQLNRRGWFGLLWGGVLGAAIVAAAWMVWRGLGWL